MPRSALLPSTDMIARCLLSGVSGILLAGSFLYPQLYLLAWLGLVPLLVAIDKVSLRQAYCLGMIHGIFLFTIGSYWVAHFLVLAKALNPWQAWFFAFGYWLFCAQMTALLAASVRWFQLHSDLPLVLTLPILGTVLYQLYPFIFPVDLALTQSKFYLALQALELTGPLGLNAVLLLANALLFELWTRRGGRGQQLQLGAGGAVIGIWLAYGGVALQYWHKAQSHWPTMSVGLVQPNAPASIPVPQPAPGYSYAFPPALSFLQQMAGKGTELVVWPETRFTGYFTLAHVRESFLDQVQRFDTALLLQDLEETANQDTYNASVLLTPSQEVQTYRKMKLIPFGESIPLPEWPILGGWLVKRFFADFYVPLKRGSERVVLEHNGRHWTPLICYEVAFPTFVAGGVGSGKRHPQFITVQSNNAWFGKTRQPVMHLAASVLRSVENRLPLVHAINNGPSAVISPTGQILVQSPAGELAALVFDLPLPPPDKRTLYSKNPYVMPLVFYALFAGLLLHAALAGPSAKPLRPALP